MRELASGVVFSPGSAADRRRAFTLVELLVVIAIISLLVAILLPALSSTRKLARQAQNVSNLKQYGTSTASYAADFEDKIWSFSWVGGKPYQVVVGRTPTGGFTYTTVTAPSDLEATAIQAADIIRRRSVPDWLTFPFQSNWIPHPTYSHLVLLDYLAARLPEPMVVAPEDKFRSQMQADPVRWGTQILPRPEYAGIRISWPYSSSYQSVPASYMPDRELTNGYLRQFGSQISYLYAAGPAGAFRLGTRLLGDVRFPNSKVHVMEDSGRHAAKKEYFFMHPQSVTTNTMFDGSVREIRTRDSNLGGYWSPGGAISRFSITYDEETGWGYPLWPDNSTRTHPMRHRWTAKGLKGIDVGGREPVP